VAELQLEGAELVLHLSGAEKAEAVHGDLRVPLSALRGVEVLDDAHSWTGIGVGFKVGMRVPGVATVATVRGHGVSELSRDSRTTGLRLLTLLHDARIEPWGKRPSASVIALRRALP
jgi:hypothetical protein